MNHSLRKITAIALAAALAASTAGCSGIRETVRTLEESKGSTASWHYSDIEGQLTADMVIREQDDFHSAVNQDWLLSNTPGEEGALIDLFRVQKDLDRQKRILIRDPGSTGYLDNTTVGLDAEEIAHAGELVARFAKEAEDTEKRTSLGAEPLRPYTEAILKIGSLEEMSAFIAGSDKNIPGSPMITVTVAATKTDPGTFRLLIRPVSSSVLTLKSQADYRWIGEDSIFAKQKKSEISRTVLMKLGMKESEVNTILARCYRLECRMAENMQKQGTVKSDDYEDLFCREMSIEEADALTGAFPLAACLKADGLDASGKVTVYEPDYMKALAKIYSEEHLEEIKAFYLVNTVYAGCDLLDPETARQISRILTRTDTEDVSVGDSTADSDGSDAEGSPEDNSAAPMDFSTGAELTPEEKATDELIDSYIVPYLSAPFDMMYIAAYLSGGEKEALTELTHTVKAELRNVLASEEWMSEESREHCVDKLDHMAERILFPDEYISCLSLDFSEDENLVDMVRSIMAYNRSRRASLIGTERTRNEWDLAECPTTVANAFNDLASNAIIIPAGISANGFTFDTNAPFEQNLARMGTILGHEMTHGFDDSGTGYDKFGTALSVQRRNELMTAEDRSVFSSKTYHLSAWYTAQSPAPGMDTYPSKVSGEAIADMGGMKCALLAASRRPDFDYDLFFRSYAELWRKICTEKVERLYAGNDVHPLAFLRTNVTVQQFDEFLNTYDVKEGDGMYLAPENRIIIW